MSVLEEFEIFSDRRGFNRSLAHFKIVNEILPEFEDGYNLADIVNAFLAQGLLENNQIAPIVSALLVDKFKYRFQSTNFPETYSITQLATVVGPWVAVDLVIAYFHPETGMVLINPKNRDSVAKIAEIKKFELVTVYAGLGPKTAELAVHKDKDALLRLAIQKCFEAIQGKKSKPPASLLKGNFKFRAFSVQPAKSSPKTASKPKATKAALSKPAPSKPALAKAQAGKLQVDIDATKISAAPVAAPTKAAPVAAPAPAPAGRMNKVGPFGVVVTNELFHNGNVEAWKRIIHSYSNKYPHYQVYVYYDGEVIHDLNSLFKWGKVKHGTAIMVAIAGPDPQIKDVSKLRKYLTEGASPRFEQFLRGLPGKDLGLF